MTTGAAEVLDPKLLRNVVRDCAMTGAIGVIMGFAVFVLLWQDESEPLWFAMILVVVALFASAFEYIRDTIEGESHDSSVSRIVIRLFLVAIFELFITALHTTLTSRPEALAEIGTVILGPKLSGASGSMVNLVVFALMWVVIGALLASGLAFAIVQRSSSLAKRALYGALVGAVAAPILTIAYVVAMRLLSEFVWVFRDPGGWAKYVYSLYESTIWSKFGALEPILKALIWLVWFAGSRIGPLVTILVLLSIAAGALYWYRDKSWPVVLLALLVIGIPVTFPASSSGLLRVGSLLLLVALVWGIPGALLGAVLPYLREPSGKRRFWAVMAWCAAACLVLFTFPLHAGWTLMVAAPLALAGIFFWRGTSVELFWPVVALTLATLLLGATQLVRNAKFLYIQELSSVVIGESLTKVAPGAAVDETTLAAGIESAARERRAERDLSTELMSNPAEWVHVAAARRLKAGADLDQAAAALRKIAETITQDGDAVRPDAGLTVKITAKLLAASHDAESLAATAQSADEALVEDDDTLKGLLQQRAVALRRPGWNGRAVGAEVAFSATTQRALDDSKRSLESELKSLQSVQDAVADRITTLRDAVAQRFELCVVGSVGFWIPLGLLAGWSRVTRGQTETATGASGEDQLVELLP